MERVAALLAGPVSAECQWTDGKCVKASNGVMKTAISARRHSDVGTLVTSIGG